MKLFISLSLAMLIHGCSSGGNSTEQRDQSDLTSFDTIEHNLSTNQIDSILKDDTIIVLKDDKYNEEVARIILPSTLEFRDANGNDICECDKIRSCVPCKVTVTRSCGSAINTKEKLSEAQPNDDRQMALLSATYDIKVNKKITPSDEITEGIKVKLKIPKCIHDKRTDKYYDFKDGEVNALKVWVQPVDSNKEGYWIEPNPQIVDGEIKFTVYTPNSHIALFGIVDKPLSGSTI